MEEIALGETASDEIIYPIGWQPEIQVPESVSMIDLRLAAIDAGWLREIENYLAALPGVEGDKARTLATYSPNVRRDHPLVEDIRRHLNKTPAEVDALFIAAGNHP